MSNVSSVSSNWAALLSQYFAVNPVKNTSDSTSVSGTQNASVSAVSSNAAGDTLQIAEALPPLQYTYNSNGTSNDDLPSGFTGSQTTKKSAAEMFASLDTDGDGTVTEAEFAAARPSDLSEDMAKNLYASFDADSSGSLTLVEYQAAMGDTSSTSSTATTSTTAASSTDSAKIAAMFNSLDTDGDGVVSAAEFAAAKPSDVSSDMAAKLFKSIDTDGDGSIASSEYEDAEKKKAEHADKNANAFQQLAMMMPPPMISYNQVSGNGSSDDSDTTTSLASDLVSFLNKVEKGTATSDDLKTMENELQQYAGTSTTTSTETTSV